MESVLSGGFSPFLPPFTRLSTCCLFQCTLDHSWRSQEQKKPAPGFLALCQGLESGPRKLTLSLNSLCPSKPNQTHEGRGWGETYLKNNNNNKFSKHSPITQNVEMENKCFPWRIGLKHTRAGIGQGGQKCASLRESVTLQRKKLTFSK